MGSFAKNDLEYARGPRQSLPADGGDVPEPVVLDVEAIKAEGRGRLGT